MQRGTFEVVSKWTVPDNCRVYGSRWVDCIKRSTDGKEHEKSRLVAQNFRDKGATGISTKSPTVSRMGQRIAIATAAMFPERTSYVRDISQAYLQSESELERLVYLRPPKEMGLAQDEVLLVKEPLYGIPESGLHWFITYHSHHTGRLRMKPTRGDPCVLYRPADSKSQCMGLTVLKVDDSFGHGDTKFLDDEERESRRFKCKPRKLVKKGDTVDFNGCCISVKENSVHWLGQDDKLRNLKVPETPEELVSTRAQIQYIGSCTRPDLCAPVQLMASAVTNPEQRTFLEMKKIVDWCHETCNVPLKYVPLDYDTIRLALFTDASFANTDLLKSQLGFVLVLIDASNRANIIHYGSSCCKRVVRSVIAAELHALTYGFDNAFLVRDVLEEVLQRKVDIDGYLDSRTVFNIVARNSSTLEKRLQIDVHALRESYTNGELRNLAWIPGAQNASGGLTKGLIDASHPLWKLIKNNKLTIDPQGWVEGSKGNPLVSSQTILPEQAHCPSKKNL